MSISSFLPGMAKPTSVGNRRATIRYRCAPATIGKVLSTEDRELQFAWILDLSQKGLGMQVARPIQPGRLIMISIKSSDGTRTFDLSARVMHCNPAPLNEWSLGCELMTSLSPDELEMLL